MGQQISTAHTMRDRENAKGQFTNGKMQAYRKDVSRRARNQPQSVARGEGKRLEMSPHEFRPEMDQEKRLVPGGSRVYYMRCPDLGVHQWERTTGPATLYAAIRMKLARIDHDEAYPVALGGKRVVMEVRFDGKKRVYRYECSGSFFPTYEGVKIDEAA